MTGTLNSLIVKYYRAKIVNKMIKPLGNSVAILIDTSQYEKYGDSNLISLKRKGGSGYNFEEYKHMPRVGKVYSVTEDEFVEDESRRIKVDLTGGDEVIFPHDIINEHNIVEIPEGLLFFAPVTRIYARRRGGEVKSLGDHVLCTKTEHKDQFGVTFELTYNVKYPTGEVKYLLDQYNDNLNINVGDKLVYAKEPYLLEDDYHRLFFNEPIYCLHRFNLLGIKET